MVWGVGAAVRTAINAPSSLNLSEPSLLHSETSRDVHLAPECECPVLSRLDSVS